MMYYFDKDLLRHTSVASYAQYYFTYFQEKSRKRCQAEEIKGNKPGYRRKSEKLLSFLRTQCRFGPFFQQRIILSFYDGIHHFQGDHTTPCLPPKILHNHRPYHGFGSHLDG